jgi:hypothetical protein
MSDITAQVVFNAERTRACLKTQDGEFVCSNMEMVGSPNAQDSITLTPVGKTRDPMKARIWVVVGISPTS